MDGLAPLLNRYFNEGAINRTRWFAEAAISLKDSTDGRAADSAAEVMIDVCFQWSPRAAIKLFDFFIDQQVISIGDGISTILNSALNHSVKESHELLIPLAMQGYSALLAIYIEKCDELFGKGHARNELERFIDRVSSASLASTQREWLIGAKKVNAIEFRII